ncbi:MAG: uroporphyrinogen-III synthase [Caulobacterales bacterium]|jgi:uroporphyrinogen-III synthase
MIRVLVTRTQPDAAATAARIAALGLTPVVAPMLEAMAVRADLPSRPAGLVVTSRQALRLANLPSAWRNLPVWTVGAGTAAAARAAGFKLIHSGAGDGAALAAALIADPPPAPLLWLRGEDVAFDLAGAGVALTQTIVYRTEPTSIPPPKAAIALFHSARAAAAFVALARPADWAKATALALSDQVGAPLQAFGFQTILVAAAPTESALIDKLAQAAA